jgi:BlaI family transcriptional regulator, penicillinase repressor
MARTKSHSLTDGETRLMTVLWDRGAATVGDITDALAARHRLTYSTVQTLLRILEQKGYVAHDKVGRAFVYRPLVDRSQAQRRALRHLIARLFDNSPGALVLNVLEDGEIPADELARLRETLDRRREEP